MRFFGESRSRAHAPADKPRDAEAMDAAAARETDAEAAKRRAQAGTKPKRDAPAEFDAAEQVRRRR
ncbi:MAG: hypothetical protein ABUL54_02920 [Dongia sp.]